MPLVIGKIYTRDQIPGLVGGGDKQSYLPHSGGVVLCGCFDPNLNKSAPIEIDVGNAPQVIRYANLVVSQGTAIPVFLKLRKNEWQYAGRFKAVLYSTEASDLYPSKPRRKDAVGVLYFEEEEEPSGDDLAPDPSVSLDAAIEGGKRLVQHFRRERRRSLVDAKRRVFRQDHGSLHCEVCNLNELNLPIEIGEGCFEVHHKTPIAKAIAKVVTKLDDLALVCANCHRMIHRSDPILSISKLRERLKLGVEA
jgi:ribosomal protein L44E